MNDEAKGKLMEEEIQRILELAGLNESLADKLLTRMGPLLKRLPAEKRVAILRAKTGKVMYDAFSEVHTAIAMIEEYGGPDIPELAEYVQDMKQIAIAMRAFTQKHATGAVTDHQYY
jgi:hypothetical protein